MDMKIYVIYTGTLYNDVNLTYSHSVLASRTNPNPESKWNKSPSLAFLINHPDVGWILYDLGSPENANSIWSPSVIETCYRLDEPDATIEKELAKINLKPQDIKYVIMSHMHMDHIGNIALFKENAEFYVAKKEAEFAFTTVCATPDASQHGFYNKADVLAEVKHLHYIEEDCELFPGVEAILLPGHTPAVTGLILHLKGKSLILTSDALNGKINYEGTLPGVIYDSIGFKESLKKIKKLEKKYNAAVWFGHDYEQFQNDMPKLPDYYS